jgi:hypothetical protein
MASDEEVEQVICGEPAISLHLHSLTGPVGQPFASRHEGPGFNPEGGTYMNPGFSCQRCLATVETLT